VLTYCKLREEERLDAGEGEKPRKNASAHIWASNRVRHSGKKSGIRNTQGRGKIFIDLRDEEPKKRE